MYDLPEFVLERARAKEPVFNADEVAAWPDDLLDQLVGDGALKATSNALSVTCDACGHDHVETVEYIQSPPGAELRAYISCPENGRVRVPLGRLRRWIVNKEELPVSPFTPAPVAPMPFSSLGTNNIEIPHALAVAHATLATALDEAIDVYKRNLRFPNPAPVIDAIERFVHEVELTPDWFAELQRRVSLVESACLQGSLYAQTRQRALSSYTATPQQLCRGKLGIDRLRGNSTSSPCFLAEVIEVRKSIEAVLEEPSLGLSPSATQAFADWREACRTVQQEAERLEVDGCWYLHHVYRAAEAGCSERSQVAKAILQTDMGGANLDLVRAAAHSIVAWIRESGIGGIDQEETAEVKRGTKKGAHDGVPKRSWTQPDLDEAIREYKAKRASTYDGLVDGVKHGRPGAKKSAQEMYGRNAIARALGVKSTAMVSKSPVWQAIADELGLRQTNSRSSGRRTSQRVGLDIAVEDQAEANSDPVLDQVIRRETVQMINKSMPSKEAEATIEKLHRREITDDQARELVEVFAEQKQDERAQKTRQGL